MQSKASTLQKSPLLYFEGLEADLRAGAIKPMTDWSNLDNKEYLNQTFTENSVQFIGL